MTGKQSAVMWLGLLLIVTRLFTTKQWSDLWAAFGTGRPTTPGAVASGQLGPYGTEPL